MTKRTVKTVAATTRGGQTMVKRGDQPSLGCRARMSRWARKRSTM